MSAPACSYHEVCANRVACRAPLADGVTARGTQSHPCWLTLWHGAWLTNSVLSTNNIHDASIQWYLADTQCTINRQQPCHLSPIARSVVIIQQNSCCVYVNPVCYQPAASVPSLSIYPMAPGWLALAGGQKGTHSSMARFMRVAVVLQFESSFMYTSKHATVSSAPPVGPAHPATPQCRPICLSFHKDFSMLNIRNRACYPPVVHCMRRTGDTR